MLVSFAGIKFIARERAGRSRVFVHGAEGATPFHAVRRALLPLLAPGTNLSFSAKAGCSCGCSPGFVVDGPQFKDERGLRADVHIELS